MLKKILKLLLGLIIFGLIISFTDYSALKNISFKLSFFILVILSTLFIVTISAFKWSLIANYFAKQKVVPFHKYLFYLLLSKVASYFNFKDIADFGVRIGSLKITKKIGLYKSFHSVFFDRLIEFIIAFLLAIPCLLFFTNTIGIWLAIYLMIFIFLIIVLILSFLKYNFFIIISKFLNLLIKIFNLIPFLERKFTKHQIIEQNKDLEIPNRLLLKIIIFDFLKFTFTILRTYLIFLTLSVKIPLIFIIVSLPLIQLSFAFAFTPGSLGIFEAGWLIILKLFQIPSSAISIFLVGQRIIIFISTLIITLSVFILFTIKNKSGCDQTGSINNQNNKTI